LAVERLPAGARRRRERATAVPAAPRLILATTTSTQDSGLLEYLLPGFEAETGADVDVIAVGTGQALQIGVDGNADVLLVHARAREDEFMARRRRCAPRGCDVQRLCHPRPGQRPGRRRRDDRRRGALTQIAAAEAPFISRGDDSGTHTKELSVWRAAGIEPAATGTSPPGRAWAQC
jgi:tungstate transport system substrate-binding protein